MANNAARTILVTGGAGYIGCILVPKLLAAGNNVVVFDAMWFGGDGLERATKGDRSGLTVVDGDLRDTAAVEKLCRSHEFDVVVHLAAVSNDPCSDLDAELTRSVNLDATRTLMEVARKSGVRRFLNASSASVYGIKDDPNVTEDLPLDPLTLYAKYKAETETILNDLLDDSFSGVSVRAATVCGYSPRLRLDLTINILTYHALTRGEIRVFGGDQLRPNVHVQDLADFYVFLADADRDKIQGRAFNVVRQNASVLELAYMIRDRISPDLPVKIVPTEDNRSYHLSGERAKRELDFAPRHDLSEAIDELRAAFSDGRVPNPGDDRYRNVEVMKKHPERTSFP